jgi:hypothetical protein
MTLYATAIPCIVVIIDATHHNSALHVLRNVVSAELSVLLSKLLKVLCLSLELEVQVKGSVNVRSMCIFRLKHYVEKSFKS